MKELGEALKLIFGKIGDFFDIFDLSFFVSGVILVSAIYVWAVLAGFNLSILLIGKMGVVIGVIGCYVAGLVSFAFGRWIRTEIIRRIFKRKSREDSFDPNFLAILKSHGLDKESSFSNYIERKESRGVWRLYIRLWADIRHSPLAEPSLQLLKRYWVMTATYDGISVSVFVWGILSFSVGGGFGSITQVPQFFLFVMGGILFLLAYACLREAGRYEKFQVEEIVASIASIRNGSL
jgi:membrane protein DedA with SNARE-associated domain